LVEWKKNEEQWKRRYRLTSVFVHVFYV